MGMRTVNSKQGFTLVELVVVIAILAILAAIAIPAVIGIMGSASDSAGESDATTMTLACRTYYGGVKSGVITSDKFTPTKCEDKIPEKNASMYDKMKAAYECTIAGALEYEGLYKKVINKLSDYGYDDSGAIVYIPSLSDEEKEKVTEIGDPAKITFEDMNYNMQ